MLAIAMTKAVYHEYIAILPTKAERLLFVSCVEKIGDSYLLPIRSKLKMPKIISLSDYVAECAHGYEFRIIMYRVGFCIYISCIYKSWETNEMELGGLELLSLKYYSVHKARIKNVTKVLDFAEKNGLIPLTLRNN